MHKRIAVFIFIMFAISVSLISQETATKDAFLGIWVLPDNSNEIEIIKRKGTYYIVEFIRIEHELFFSTDEKRALFIESGKGPAFPAGIGIGDDGNTVTLYGISDSGEWVTSYIFRRKR